MTAQEIIKKMQAMEEKALAEPLYDEKMKLFNEMQKFLEQQCNAVDIMFPHLDDVTLRPVAELAPGTKCPRGLDGKCNSCDHFVCYSGDNEIFAYKHFTGYCTKEDTANAQTSPEEISEGVKRSEEENANAI